MSDYKIDYDKPGFCALCHTEIAEFNGSDSKGNMIITQLKGNADSVEFVLSDKSKMKVAICIECKDSMTPEDAPKIMDSVVKGWAYEVGQLHWDQTKKESHMEKYSKLEIESRHDLKWTDSEIDRLDTAIQEFKSKLKSKEIILSEEITKEI